jgi:YD repeat-containing protein
VHCGQLNTITNAAGHVTTYNVHGQPTQITDANGLVTTFAYDARQRMVGYQIKSGKSRSLIDREINRQTKVRLDYVVKK